MNAKSIFTKFIHQIMLDIDGKYSIKRFLSLVAFLLLIIAFIANLFFGYVMAQFIFDGFVYMLIGMLGITSVTERGIPILKSPNAPKAPVDAGSE